MLLLAVAQKSLCSQVNGQTRRQVGRIEGKRFVHIWRPFVEKHYVMEFIRFLLFPLQTPGSCKHTHLRRMRPEETRINKHSHTRDMDVSPEVQLNKLWMYLSEQDGVKCLLLGLDHCARELLKGAPGDFLQMAQALKCCTHVQCESISCLCVCFRSNWNGHKIKTLFFF